MPAKPQAEPPVEKPIPQDAPKSASMAFLDQTHAQQQQSEVARAQESAQHNADVSARFGDGMVAQPGARLERLADLIDHDYVAEDHRSIFADAHKYLKDPKPGALYCWAAIEGKSANKTFAMIRRGYYRRVEAEELRDDVDIPVYTHKTATGEFVCVYDVCLVEQPAEVVRKLREFPKQGAILRTAQAAAFRDFAGQTRDMTGGGARASMTVTDDAGRATTFEE